jgi:hypothetical protein
MARRCTVTVSDASGRRHSLDLVAESSFDAAHLFVTEVKAHRGRGSILPTPTRDTLFEVAVEGRVYRVPGEKLQSWILKRRGTWNGPKGYLFNKRPLLD